jgi:hypothetical protein
MTYCAGCGEDRDRATNAHSPGAGTLSVPGRMSLLEHDARGVLAELRHGKSHSKVLCGDLPAPWREWGSLRARGEIAKWEAWCVRLERTALLGIQLPSSAAGGSGSVPKVQ